MTDAFYDPNRDACLFEIGPLFDCSQLDARRNVVFVIAQYAQNCGDAMLLDEFRVAVRAD